MATTSATSSRLHPAIQQGLRDGSVARMKIGEKFYLVYKVQDGALTPSPFSPAANVEKIRQVAQLAIDTHKAAARSTPSLEGKEITHMTGLGASFEGDPTPFGHSSATVTSAEDYLRATDDLAWQTPVLALSAKLNRMRDADATLSARELPPEFRAYLEHKGAPQPTYPVHSDPASRTIGLEEHLLDFTREKIKQTHAVYGQVQTEKPEPEYREDIHNYVKRFDSVETAIKASNDFIKANFTAKHIWQTLINLTNDATPEIYQAPASMIPIDEEHERTRPLSSPASSVVHDPRHGPLVVAEDLDHPLSSSSLESPEVPRGRRRARSLSLPPRDHSEDVSERRRSLTPTPRRRSENRDEDEMRERGRSRSLSVSSSPSRSRSSSRERIPSPVTVRQEHRDGPLPRVGLEHGQDPLTAVESDSKRIPFQVASEEDRRGASSSRGNVSFIRSTTTQRRKNYMSEEDSRLTRAYRTLLPQIQGPVLEGAKHYRGAYDKLQRFKEDHEREELEPLSQGELLAVREAHQKVMEVQDYKRHADLKDARFFNAILYQLKIKN